MKAKFFKFMTCVIMCGGIVAFWAGKSYCDTIPEPHIDIKGKITTSDGQPIEGARLRLQTVGNSSTRVSAPFVIGVPTTASIHAVSTESGGGSSPYIYTTSSTGEYHIILKFIPEHGGPGGPPVQADVSTFSIDKSKMNWEKGGYVIRPK